MLDTPPGLLPAVLPSATVMQHQGDNFSMRTYQSPRGSVKRPPRRQKPEPKYGIDRYGMWVKEADDPAGSQPRAASVRKWAASQRTKARKRSSCRQSACGKVYSSTPSAA